MRVRFTLLTLLAAAIAATVFALLPTSAGADNKTFTFSGSYTPADCGPPFDFPVGANTKTIDIDATADNPVNDVVVKLVKDGNILAEQDTGTSPEPLHYEPDGGIAQGAYQALVCPFDANQNLLT